MTDDRSASSEPDDATSTDAPGTTGESAGEVIDRYTLIDELGEGGMGTVWRARQTVPVRREVALKIIKLGMDTREVVTRFEAERQALALMDHPHIAKVLDGGATEGGRPFFVMELVQGAPITEFCGEHRLDLGQRLALFVQVCEAIQHAHHKGIIHRDIKPSNVLVALHDGVPVPKVIDFGIAKATSAELTQQTLLTQHAQIVGTPEYMAPEQADAGGLDIDTRADVYSLGVLLYELLTGTKPFDMRAVLEVGYQELLRTIREVDPDRPSTRVSTIAGPKGSDAPFATRDTLSRHLRGDLDWVVMKAIEKERDRRYDTPRELAADVARYLNEEPVVAAPPSAVYRLRKLMVRRKKTVAAVAVIAVVLVAGTIGTSIGLWRAIEANRKLDTALDEKNRAFDELDQALVAKTQALDEKGLALREKQQAFEQRGEALAAKTEALEAKEQALADLEQVASFQSAQLFELDAYEMGTRLRAAMLDAGPQEDRAALAENLDDLNFTSLALQSLEENLFQRSLDAIDVQFADQPLVQAQLLQTMADNLLQLGLYEAAVDPQERALALRRAELGDEHRDTLTSVNRTGTLLSELGRQAEAEAFYLEALEGRRRVLGEDDPETLKGLNNMGLCLTRLGRFEEAEVYHREALERRRRVLGDEHADTLNSLNNLGFLLDDLGRLDEAEALLREALDGRRRILGNDRLETLTTVANLATLLQRREQYAEAELYLRESLDGCRRTLGDEHSRTLSSLNNLGFLLKERGRLDEAEVLYRQALQGQRSALGDDHFLTLTSVNNLAGLLADQGRTEAAEAYYREALTGFRLVLGSDHPTTLTLANNLANHLRKAGRPDEAEPLSWEALRGLHATLGKDHATTAIAFRGLKRVLSAREAAARESGDDALLASSRARLGSAYLLLEDPASAEVVLVEALGVLEAQPDLAPSTWQVGLDLGRAIADQGRFSEAQALLVESAEMLLESDSSTADKAGAVDRLIAFYGAWQAAEPESGHDADQREWQARRDRLSIEPTAR